ncbi:hypothetical protein RHEC894_PE00143 (plasmid) [Rhizobium sp. CIAT894]|nr:hypothetical protein RHEC894_PE00143 [Rhizobium sp. CIAT894]
MRDTLGAVGQRHDAAVHGQIWAASALGLNWSASRCVFEAQSLTTNLFQVRRHDGAVLSDYR